MRIESLLSSLGSLAVVLTLAAQARAGVVTGRCVDAQGNGIAGVNLDFDPMSGGGNPTVLNDGTDINGYFTTTVTPSNNYRVTFLPPPPPGSTALVLRVDNVVVTAGVTNLGNVVMPAGVELSGRCVDNLGAGVAGVNIDVIDSTGDNLTLVNDMTDALGYFDLAVPMGAIEVRFDTTPVVGALLAPKALSLDLSGAYAAGNVVLAPGFTLSALVKRLSNNTAVQDVELDVVDSVTHQLLYTPGDNTDAAGFVDVVVPAGTYDIQFTPPFALHLVGHEIENRPLSSTTFLGTILLQDGVVLSGTVLGWDGSAHGGVDADAVAVATGAHVFLGSDNTNASGFYQVIVPTGSFDVSFSPPMSIPFGAVTYANVAVNSNTTLNGTLPACAFFTNVGTGVAGLGGITPQVSATGGAPRIGNPNYRFQCTQGRGGAKAIVVYALVPYPNPLPNPCQIVPPTTRKVVQLSGPLGVAGAGAASYAFPLADDPLLAGYLIRAWFIVRDGAVPNGKASTNELRATVCL